MIPRKDRKTKQRGEAQAIYTDFALLPGSRPALCVFGRGSKAGTGVARFFGGRGVAPGRLVTAAGVGKLEVS